MKNILSLFLSIVCCSFHPLIAQKEIEREQHLFTQSIPEVRSLVLSGNKIKTIVYNTGSVSGPGVIANVYDLTWKGLGYGYEFGFMAGTKVPVNNGLDSAAIFIDGFGASNGNTADGDFAPDYLSKWGWLPKAGYARKGEAEFANNLNPSTWPESWSSWKGKAGTAIADLESFYVLTDSSDKEFSYIPFPADSSRRGLGLQTEVRHFLFTHPSLEDMFMTTYSMKNVSPKDLPAMRGVIFGDPHIGGANNFADDATNFDSARALAYSWDPDHLSDIPALPPGYFGTLFTETPISKGLSSYVSVPWGGANRPKNDSLMYLYTLPGNFSQNGFYPPEWNTGDYAMVLGSGNFPLESGESQTLGVVYLFADDLASLTAKADHIRKAYDVLFTVHGPRVSITSPVQDQIVQSNTVMITWSTDPMVGDSTVTLYYGNSYQQTWWTTIAKRLPNNGSFQWDVSQLPDGIFTKVHLSIDKDGAISYDSSDGYFTLNRPGDAAPEIVMISPVKGNFQDMIPVRWIAGDADGDPVSVKIFYSDNNGATYTLIKETENSGLFLFNSRMVANTRSAKMKVDVLANGKTTSRESAPFQIINYYSALTDTATMKHSKGHGTGAVIPGVADSALLTGDRYRVAFDSLNGNLTYSLTDLTSSQIKTVNEVMTHLTGSGKMIDGMRLWFRNDPLGLDSLRSGFSLSSVTENVSVRYARPSIGTFRPAPLDMVITFSTLDTNSLGEFIQPMDTVGSSANPYGKVVRIPFTITSLYDTTLFQAMVREKTGAGFKSNQWDIEEEIVILTPLPYRIATGNTLASITFKRINPMDKKFGVSEKAVYTAYTTKPFTADDVFEFTADAKFGKPTSVRRQMSPVRYELTQNYPNPFNPETKIQFSLQYAGAASLVLYDALGRIVITLISQNMEAGTYTVQWDGRNSIGRPASSGIYFYRLTSGNFSTTKKMILMR